MIIGCTGNYRKTEYFDIITYVNDYLSNNNIRCIVSSDLYNLDNINKKNINDNF